MYSFQSLVRNLTFQIKHHGNEIYVADLRETEKELRLLKKKTERLHDFSSFCEHKQKLSFSLAEPLIPALQVLRIPSNSNQTSKMKSELSTEEL